MMGDSVLPQEPSLEIGERKPDEGRRMCFLSIKTRADCKAVVGSENPRAHEQLNKRIEKRGKDGDTPS
jgi:hypothetical protein